MSMTVCMISYSSHPDSRVYRYIKSLNERGDTADVICLGQKDDPRFETDACGNRIFRIQSRTYSERSIASHVVPMVRFFILSAGWCTRLYAEKRYPVIHFHNVPDFGVFCTAVPKCLGAKVILDIHDIVPEFYMRRFRVGQNHTAIRFIRWVERMAARYADHVITVTDIWRERLIGRSVEADKCTTILNTPYVPLFSRKRDPAPPGRRSFLLSYHGALTEPTGVETLIRAMPRVASRFHRIRLQIVGKGRERPRLIELTKHLHLEKHVHFIESVEFTKIPGLLDRVDIGVDPKRDGIYAGETLSVKTMEYLVCGIPAIVSRTPAAEAYFDDRMVMFFEPDNEKDLARCIIELVRSPRKRNALSRTGRLFFEKYGWNRYKKRYFRLLDTL